MSEAPNDTEDAQEAGNEPENLAEAQKIRKQLAKDAQMLANRINLLK